MYCFVRFQKGLRSLRWKLPDGLIFCTTSNIYRYIPTNSHKTLTNYVPVFSGRITLSIGENRMKIRAVVFEFIADRQTDWQTDRRGGGLCFIICIDFVNYEIFLLILFLPNLKLYMCQAFFPLKRCSLEFKRYPRSNKMTWWSSECRGVFRDGLIVFCQFHNYIVLKKNCYHFIRRFCSPVCGQTTRSWSHCNPDTQIFAASLWKTS